MSLSKDERRALAFIAFVVLLAAGVRLVGRAPAAEADLGEVELGELAESNRAAMAADARRSQPLAPGERINPNTADEIELQRLPGVGAAVAARIVADRAANGPYRAVSDLTRVTGIGAATVARLAQHLALPESAAPATGALSGFSASRPRAAAPQGKGSGGDLVDINTASAEELQRLPGIGPAIAGRIIAFRDTAGPFRSPAELERVPGIGPATLQRITPHLRLSP
ncbi:MAG TPA: ComEA family DNA-binding protein [Longimicrobiales bacterium]|nr:ComEA family DNA-binding protein [Longimicrobiales bacterium]